jgi:hypothetical protein
MRALMLALALCTSLIATAFACEGIPPLAAALDELLPEASLSASDRAKVVALRERLKQLDAGGDKEGARRVEEQAMKLLGYQKEWLKCGPGSFTWVEDERPPPKAAG